MDGKYMIALATKCVRMCEANARHPAQTIQMFDLTETNRLTSQVLILGLINANTRWFNIVVQCVCVRYFLI